MLSSSDWNAPPLPPEPLVEVRVLDHAIFANGQRIDIGEVCSLPCSDALSMAKMRLVEVLE